MACSSADIGSSNCRSAPAAPTTQGRLSATVPMPYSGAADTETMKIRFSSRVIARMMRATAAATP